nr:PREDICTED: uncharacterized protein LOC109034584 [Bemisia tabaci]
MASLKFALAALALSAVVINSVVADEAAQAAKLDGGYPKFPSRFRRQTYVPQVPQIPSDISGISNYKPPSFPTNVPTVPSMPTNMPTVPSMPTMPTGGYGEYMKPEHWQQYTNGLPGTGTGTGGGASQS